MHLAQERDVRPHVRHGHRWHDACLRGPTRRECRAGKRHPAGGRVQEAHVGGGATGDFGERVRDERAARRAEDEITRRACAVGECGGPNLRTLGRDQQSIGVLHFGLYHQVVYKNIPIKKTMRELLKKEICPRQTEPPRRAHWRDHLAAMPLTESIFSASASTSRRVRRDAAGSTKTVWRGAYRFSSCAVS